jgi:DNA-binding transcriptional ArsR family regulator
MAKLLPWVMMPSGWIVQGGLRDFQWAKSEGANNIAALMVLAPILHRADRDVGVAKLTYDEFESATSLSRSKISAGLRILNERGVIARERYGQSSYALTDFSPAGGWAKFPAARLYAGGQITFFNELHLRRRPELDALKLWYFIAARRDNDVNLAKATYDQIVEVTGIPRDRIKSGLSVLAANGMVHVEHIPSRYSDYGVANAYRLPQIDGARHMGSTGRGLTQFDEF